MEVNFTREALTRVQELKTVVGQEASCNSSPTLRAKLIEVGNNHCRLEVTAPVYAKRGYESIGKVFRLSTYEVHNMFFF